MFCKEMDQDKLDGELKMLLEELRVALPGMQMLFAFLLTIPFNAGFEKATTLQQRVYAFDLMCTTASSIFLIAPTMYHRLHWRRDAADKERMLRVFNKLAIIGGAFLSLAMITSIYLIIDYVFG